MTMLPYTAARDWAAEHGHQTPDDRMLNAYGAALLRDVADLIDRGPVIPLPPSIYSALVRERADLLMPAAATTEPVCLQCSPAPVTFRCRELGHTIRPN